jgi:hypothetical protein
MICAALGAVQVVVFLSLSAVTPSLAATFPPAYAVVAGVHSVMLFLARRLTGVTGAATITALITGLLVFAFSVLGPLVLIPLLAAGLTFDAALAISGRRSRRGGDAAEPRTPEWHYVLAATAAGAVLFLVSLPVFSAEHLTAPLLIATFAGRVVGEVGAALVAGVLARALERAGVRRR